MISRIFTLFAPFVGDLAIYWKPLPMIVLGIPTVLAGLLALTLPETSGKELPQNIQEADMVSSLLFWYKLICINLSIYYIKIKIGIKAKKFAPFLISLHF